MQDLTPRLKPSLAELQSWLRGVLTEPRGIHAALEGSQPLLQTITEAPPLPVEERLDVYANAYFLRLLESLEADFPATRRALGSEVFRYLAADYLQQHPSMSPNVSDLGHALPAFIQNHSTVKEFPFLPDLIQLEWAVIESIYAERLPAIDLTALQNIAPEAWPQARLTLDPTVHVLKTDWAVDRLWEKRREPEKKRPHRLPRPQPRWFLLYRQDVVELRVIDQPRGLALKRLQEGAALGLVCEELAAEFPGQNDTLPVMEWFSHWMRAGVIKKIEF